LIYLPSAYLFSAQLWSSLEISPLWPCFHLCFVIKPFDPHQRFVAESWMTGDETEWSFARRRSTESFYPVFSGDCLLPPSLYCRNGFVRDFVPSSDCRRWLPVDTWHGRRWVFPVPSLLSGPEGNLAVPGKSDGIELYHPSSTVLRTTWIPHYKWKFYLLALYGGCQWD